jgi:hypothetical protein
MHNALMKRFFLNQQTAHGQKSANFNKSYPSNRTVTVDAANKGNHTKYATKILVHFVTQAF